MIVEGVPYHRHVVTFRLTSGERRRWIRWSPASYFLRAEFAREVEDRELPVRDRSARVYHDWRNCPECAG
jgi:hypothetical protein